MIHFSFISDKSVFITRRCLASENRMWDRRDYQGLEKARDNVRKVAHVILEELAKALEVSEGAVFSYIDSLRVGTEFTGYLTPAERSVLDEFYSLYTLAIMPTIRGRTDPTVASFNYFNCRSGNAVVWSHLTDQGFRASVLR